MLVLTIFVALELTASPFLLLQRFDSRTIMPVRTVNIVETVG